VEIVIDVLVIGTTHRLQDKDPSHLTLAPQKGPW